MAKLNSLLEKNGIKELSSFSKTKDFKKRTTQDMIPNTFCSRYLVDKFRKEAKEKRWSYTTLMTAILEDRYGKDKILVINHKKCKNFKYNISIN